MKKNRFAKNKKDQKSTNNNLQVDVLKEKKYESFYNLVKRRIHSL